MFVPASLVPIARICFTSMLEATTAACIYVTSDPSDTDIGSVSREARSSSATTLTHDKRIETSFICDGKFTSWDRKLASRFLVNPLICSLLCDICHIRRRTS